MTDNEENQVRKAVENIKSMVEGDVWDDEDLESEVSKYLNMGVPRDEAEESVVKKMVRDEGISTTGGEDRDVASEKSLDSFDEEGQWGTVEVKVVEIWDNENDKIHQTGLIADGSGRVKFTIFSGDNSPTLEEGKSYKIKNVVSDEWNNNINVKFVDSTEVEELEDEVEVDKTVEISGCIVDLQKGSGLIFRDETGSVVQNKNESEGETESDLRLKVILDDGNQTYTVFFDRELTEGMTGIRLEEAKDMAQEQLDKEVVREAMGDEVIGKYMTVEAVNYNGNYIADNYSEFKGYDLEELLVKARGVQNE